MLSPVFFTLLLAIDPDWPQFRGPLSNPVGDDKRLAEKWSTKENVEWSAMIPGRGWSSPIVSGNRIFLTSVVTDGESKKPQTGTEYSNEYIAELLKQGLSAKDAIAKVTERDFELPHQVNLHYFLYCLELKSGKVEWKREIYAGHPPGGRHRKNSFTSETPVTDGKAVYVYIGNLGIWAYDIKGKAMWSAKVENNPIYLDFGTAASPILVRDQLMVISDNQKHQFFASYDKNTGKLLWSSDRDIGEQRGEMSMRSGWATPYLWKNPLRTEIVTVGPGTAISYDLEGKELWRLSGMAATPVPSPFSYDGLLYLDAGRGKYLFAIKPGGKGDITPARGESKAEYVEWSDQRGGTYLPSPVAYNGAVYTLTETGILTRFDAKTGKVSYKQRILADGSAGYFTTSPWAYNGKIFCLSEEGRTFVISAGDKFELLGENNLEEMALATPAIVGDRLLIRTETKLYSIRGTAKN